LDVLFTGVVPKECAGLVSDQGTCAGKKFDAVLFPANFGANPPARAGYPSVIVPGEFFRPNLALLPPGFVPNQSPFGVTFSGPAFSESRLIRFAYAFEQATQHRVPPASAPALAAK
jgi:amidase